MLRIKASVVPAILIALLLLLLGYPTLSWLVRSWLANPYYTHGFLVPPLAALLAWLPWRRRATVPRRGHPAGLLLTAAALALVVWAQWRSHYVPACFGWIALVAGILLYVEGWERLKLWLFPLLFLGLMVPLPVVDRLSPLLESLTARSAAGLVRLLGVPVQQQGGEIVLPGSTVIVGAPCSGLRSLVVMVTLGTAWVYLVAGRLRCKLALLLTIVPLVFASNVVRITILLALAVRWGSEVALDYYHTWSSPLLFVLALGLLLAFGRILGCAGLRDDLF